MLSSGWLGFALHAGVLQAVEEAEGVGVKSVMGTSSGAFAGSLYCAGYSPIELSREISRVPPIKLLRTHMRPWEGFFLLDGVVERLRWAKCGETSFSPRDVRHAEERVECCAP